MSTSTHPPRTPHGSRTMPRGTGTRLTLLLGLLAGALPARGQEIRVGVPDPEVRFTDGVRTLLVSQIGYASPGERRAFLMAPARVDGEAITRYTVEDDSGRVRIDGAPRYVGSWVTAHFWQLDLAALGAGDYRIRAGSLASQLFPVRDPRELWFDPHARDMAVEQLRARFRSDAQGGFIDCGNDIRETNSHGTLALGLVALLEGHSAWLSPAEVSEIEGFLVHIEEFLYTQQEPSGRIIGGWAWGAPITDGLWPNHLRGLTALLAMERYWSFRSPGRAAGLRAAAGRALGFVRGTMVLASTETPFLLERLRVEVEDWEATGAPAPLAAARAVALELRARQVRPEEVAAGTFYGQLRLTASGTALTRLNHHDFGIWTGAYAGVPLEPLVRLWTRLPDDPDAPGWRSLVGDWVAGFLLPAGGTSPLGLVPNGVYGGDLHWFSDLFHGMSMTYAMEASAAVAYGEALGLTALYDLAERQLLWIGGLNTGAGFPVGVGPFSCITGKGYQWLRDGHGSFPDIPGSIVNGLSATPQFVKQMPPGPEAPEYLGDESYISHTGGWLEAAGALVRARLDLGSTLLAARAPGDRVELRWEPPARALGYRVWTGQRRDGLDLAEWSVVGPTSLVTVPAPAPPLSLLRVSARDDATEGPR